MRTIFALLAPVLLVACAASVEEAPPPLQAGPDSFSVGGLSFNSGAGAFSGLAPTLLADMPSGPGANAVYTGAYTAESLAGVDASGSAALALDFVAATADLSLTGDLSTTMPGVIDGTGVRSAAAGTDLFEGQFYNSGPATGDVVAGAFTHITTPNDAGTFLGRFIVER